jgi:hypothetical protein
VKSLLFTAEAAFDQQRLKQAGLKARLPDPVKTHGCIQEAAGVRYDGQSRAAHGIHQSGGNPGRLPGLLTWNKLRSETFLLADQCGDTSRDAASNDSHGITAIHGPP